jgi:hydroxymethylbilane synthase
VPLGAYAIMREDALFLRGFVASPDGKTLLQAEATGNPSEPEALGQQLANTLREQGADAILSALAG